LEPLRDELNIYLASKYGIRPGKKTAFANWLSSHQPFHWFVEFYRIMNSGGFDVIIGNPPYLDLKQLTNYTPLDYFTLPTKNLYSLVLERCASFARGWQGYIVPISSIATQGYTLLQEVLLKRRMWTVSFDDRPAHLFDGLDKNTLTILLLSKREPLSRVTSSRLNRWNSAERGYLFPRLRFYSTPRCRLPGSLPRTGSDLEFRIWQKVFDRPEAMGTALSTLGGATIYYSRKVNAFLQILDFVPEVRDGRGKSRAPSEFKELRFVEPAEASAALCMLNSSLFRWFVDVVSDGSHLNRREIDLFPFDPRTASKFAAAFMKLGKSLTRDLRENSLTRRMTYRHDTLTVQCLVPRFSKSIIDEIDCIVAQHYGFTGHELDFIVNYDIKYRVGNDSADTGESGEDRDD